MSRFQTYFQRWASRRAPRAQKVILKHRTIYVFPSKQGVGYLLVVLLVWILGTNYQNNLILAFSYLLTSVLLVSIVHAFKNLLGLTFEAATVQASTLGESAIFDIQLSSQYLSTHHSVLFALGKSDSVCVDLSPKETLCVRLHAPAKQRGWQNLPRITIKSYFPFGVIRAWTYIDLAHRALVFPKPIATKNPPLGALEGEAGNQLSQSMGDEFHGFQSYSAGAPLSQVAWKQYARGAGLHLKDYRAEQSSHYWLDWQYLSSSDTELKLSYLCYWVNEFSNNNIEFGMILPHKIIPMGQGDKHRLDALTALALFGWIDE